MGTFKLKRKEFALPALVSGTMSVLGAAATPMMGVQMYQEHKNAEAQEEQSQAQEAAMKQQTKAINNLAEQAKKNPIVQMQAAQVMQKGYSSVLSRKTFSKNILSNSKGLLKDVWETWGWNKKGGWVKDGLKFGGIGAVLTYGANKWVQKDMKKEGLQLPNQQPVQTNHSESVISKYFAEAAAMKNAAKEEAAKKGKSVLGKMAPSPISAVFYAMEPVGTLTGYYGQKASMKKMQQATSGNIQQQQPAFRQTVHSESLLSGVGQRNFSVISAIGRGLKWAGSGLKSGIEMFGLGGTKKIQEIGRKWELKGSGDYSKKVGKFMQEHPKTVVAAGIPIGFIGMSTAFDLGGKVGKKPFELMDKNAYAWDKSQEQKVE